jgi:hypothetical protein
MSSYFLFFFALAFDYKGVDEGGSLLQFISFAIAILSGIYIIMRTPRPTGLSRWYVIVGNLLVIHLISTVVVEVIQWVEIGRYFRIASPYYLLVLGYFVGARAIYKIGFNKTARLVMVASSAAVMFTIFYGLETADFSVNGIRYQIVSPMILVLVPLLAHKLFVEKRHVFVAALIVDHKV